MSERSWRPQLSTSRDRLQVLQVASKPLGKDLESRCYIFEGLLDQLLASCLGPLVCQFHPQIPNLCVSRLPCRFFFHVAHRWRIENASQEDIWYVSSRKKGAA